jgi:hypothetical protein
MRILHASATAPQGGTMQLDLASPLLALDPGQVVTLDDARGTCIRARYGAVWITEEGSNRDFIVEPGEVHVVTRAGRTVVQAMQAAWIALRPDCQPLPGQVS